MENYKDKLDLQKLPQHLAVIMDGNGRWAQKMGKPRIFGHRNGVKAVREISEASAELGIPYLTLYAFSTENWMRPALEVRALMSLLIDTISNELETLQENDIKLNCIGNVEKLPSGSYKALLKGMEETKNNKRMTLTLALNYSSRWEMEEAIKKIAQDISDGKSNIEDINEQFISSHLSTAGIPDPELMIRTSGEQRISNYLLWQLAYAELYFTDVLWPDFRREDLYRAIYQFQHRERRFGKISEQLS